MCLPLCIAWLPSLAFLLFSGNEPQGNGSEDQGPSYSGGASVGGPGGDSRAADPFAMMSEETRRLQCKCMPLGLWKGQRGGLGQGFHFLLLQT